MVGNLGFRDHRVYQYLGCLGFRAPGVLGNLGVRAQRVYRTFRVSGSRV